MGYRGEVEFRYKCTGSLLDNNIYYSGDRVGQIIILPYPQIEFEEADELSSTDRGTGGFGHTGN